LTHVNIKAGFVARNPIAIVIVFVIERIKNLDCDYDNDYESERKFTNA